MLSRCLNPDCGAPFHYLSEGRVFPIERVLTRPGDREPQRILDPYWLCASCSLQFKVVVENGAVTVQPIRVEPVDCEVARDNSIAGA